MKRLLVLGGGIGILVACLAGWAVPASAQSGAGPSLPGPSSTAESGSVLPPGSPPPGGLAMPLPPSLADTIPAPAIITPAASPPPVQQPDPTPQTLRPTAIPGVTEITPNRAAKPAEPSTEAGSESVTGRQEPAVSLEWVGVPAAKVGQPADYSLVIRNISNNPVYQVKVRALIPVGLSLVGSEPRAALEDGMQAWDLGTLASKQERVLQLKMKADSKGDVTPRAWVTFTGTSVLRIRVREPRLALKCSTPEKVMVGDPAAFTLIVSNPGDGSAEQIKIHAVLSEGLEHARGNKIDVDIGSLAPGESRNVSLLCGTRGSGVQQCEVTAEAEGGMTARDTASVKVNTPRLDLQLSGPRLRYLDQRAAIYTLKVSNPGDAPATNVTVAHTIPIGFKVLAASDSGRHDSQTRTVSWFLGEVAPGQMREVKLEVQAVNVGEYRHKAMAVGARGLRVESELPCKIEGLPALAVDLVDTDDPVEVGGDTAYEVRITNTGSKSDEDIKLIAAIPDKMQFKSAQGPARYREEGKLIIFEPVARLAPRADAIFRINVKAVEAGTVRFKINVTSANDKEPVIKMEPTRIYSDAPETGTGTPSVPPSATPPAPMGPVPSMPVPGTLPPPPGTAGPGGE